MMRILAGGWRWMACAWVFTLLVLGGVAEAAGRKADPWQEGDIVFIRIGNPLYRMVARTSGSWESHVGVLFRARGGGWEVAESTIPVSKFTPLEKFLAHSEGGDVAVLRVRGGLTSSQKQRLRRAAESRMGIWYHLGFNYDSDRLYCSKLVYEIYREATGRGIGRLQTFGEVLGENPQAPVWFWRIWFFGRIPWDRRVVTTTSQLHSPRCITVWQHVPLR